MQRALLWALHAQVWLLVVCLSAGRIVDAQFAGVRVSLGADAHKLVPLLALTWLAWRWTEPRRPWRCLSLIAPWALLSVVAMLSALGAVDRHSAVRTGIEFSLCALLLVVLIDLPWTRRALGAALAAFLLGNAYNFWLVMQQHQAGIARATGSFAHPNILGSFCLLSLGLLAFTLFVARRLWARVFIAAMLLGCVVTIYLTSSRATYVGLLAFMATILLVGSRRELIYTSILLAVLLAVAAGNERVRDRLRHTQEQWKTGAGMDRLTVWELSLAILREHPRPLGIGIGRSFNQVANQAPYVAADPELSRIAHAHNLYLHVLIALGPAGLFALCWAMLSMYVYVLRPIMLEYGTTYTSSPFLLAGLSGLLAEQLFDTSVLQQNVLPTLVAYLAFATILLELRRRPTPDAPAARSPRATA